MTNSLRAILLGGSLCALPDGTCVTLLYNAKGIKPVQMWQAVASAILGPSSFRDGWAAGLLGIALHCFVAWSVASVFVLASRNAPILLQHPIFTGIAYGLLVFVVMNMVVVPLSAMPKRPVNMSVVLTQLAMHIALVGVPISISARYFLR